MTGDMGMTYHAMFSLYIMTGLLALMGVGVVLIIHERVGTGDEQNCL